MARYGSTDTFELSEGFDDLIDLLGHEDGTVFDVGHLNIFGSEFEKDAIKLLVVVDVLFAAFALDFVERWLGDINVACLDEPFHLTI